MRNEEPLNRGYWSLVLCVIFVLVYKIHGITICCTFIRFLYLKNHHQEMCEQDKILLIIKYIFEWWIKHSYANNFVFRYINTIHTADIPLVSGKPHINTNTNGVVEFTDMLCSDVCCYRCMSPHATGNEKWT